MIGSRRGKPRTVKVRSFGEEIELTLKPVSALEMDAIRQQFPEPVVPRREVDGVLKADPLDPEYQHKMYAWVKLFVALKVCRMLGPEAFGGVSDLAEQVRLLQSDFTEAELRVLADEAQRVDSGEVSPADEERAKAAVYPTVSGSDFQIPQPA